MKKQHLFELYLICFQTTPKEFDQVLKDDKLASSCQRLLSFYRDYIDKHGIDFPIGTHEIPNSITTPRYERIIKKNQYSDVIVWGAGDYYEDMASIFEEVNIRYHIDDKGKDNREKMFPPDVLSKISEPFPIFICSPRKQEIKVRIISEYPNFRGRLFV